MTPPTIDLLKDTPETSESAIPSFEETGWHEELVPQPDGTIEIVWTPLTEAEFLHPREGDHLPTNTFHDRTVTSLKDLLGRWFGHQPQTCIFSDLLIKWDIKLKDHSPDLFVVFDVKDPKRIRSKFVVAKEGVRPALIVEVVSPRYRNADRKTKVGQYARANVQEYIILDRRRYQGEFLEEVIGYQQVAPGLYQPITPDGSGRILSQVAGLWISFQDGELVLENAATGERLLYSWELEQRAEEERLRAEAADQRAEEERLRAAAADQRAEEERQRVQQLVDFLQSQGYDPGQI